MAYQTRGRDPLFDSEMAQTLEKRSKELLGIALLVVASGLGVLLFSYHPDDPYFLSASEQPAQNLLGRFGASVAAPVHMVVGLGGWGLFAVIAAWGLRMVLHTGADRALGRLIFVPVWLAVLSLYAASLTPDAVWAAAHSFGLGGLFGDTVLAMLLNILPVHASFGLKLLSALLGLGMVVLGAFVLGFTRAELGRAARFMLIGLIMSYAKIMVLLGRGASGAVQAAQSVQARKEARRQAAAAGMIASDAMADMPAADMPADAPAAPRKPGLLSRVPGLVRRPDEMPEPELIEAHAPDYDAPDMPGEARIRAKISDAIKSRVRGVAAPALAADKPLTKGRGRGPDPLIFDAKAAHALPPEPPLTARSAAAVAPAADNIFTDVHAGADHAEGADMAYGQGDDFARDNFARDDFTSDDFTTDGAAYFASDRGYGMGGYADADATHYDPGHGAAYSDDDGDEKPGFIAQAVNPPAVPLPEARKVVQHPPRKPLQPSARARAEAQPKLPLEESAAQSYELPPLSLLANPVHIQRHHLSDEALEENARMLETVLDDYGVKGEIVSVRPGPVVTMYELEPAPGLKASRVIGLADDIARSMSALSARVSTVPGRSVIGIELPNDNREMVSFREILSSRAYGDGSHKLPLALGKDIGGEPMVANLAKMPHLLIAGTTGSGKSVAINTMILSLLYKLTPDDCRLIMIDPKMLELSVYDGIPHLLSPVVTDPKKAVVALKWVVGEMEERYRKMSKMGVRNIDGYNGRVADALSRGEMFERTVQTGFDEETGDPIFESEEFEPKKMPYIVVIVDEMADLMMVAGKEIEACIQRLAQMARASGIHLIMATQRPSVDVITGTIKANFPTRISFQVTSKIDSRTILGEMGAEQLLGQGDMLYMAGGAKITRCHGPFVSDEEVEEIVTYLKAYGPPEYLGGVLDGPDDDKAENIDLVLGLNTGGNTSGEDALYDQAVAIVIKDRKCSTSYIQRKLGIGYNKSARLVEQMEEEGVVTPANHVGKREILVPEQ